MDNYDRFAVRLTAILAVMALILLVRLWARC